MARSGGFAGGLSPFGSGSLGNLGQYDIGADLANLAVYQTEVAWGNGQATDADYLGALRSAVAAADMTTQTGLSAQNKLDDAIYRIGRSQAENAGPDALIAFDQAALAGMSPDNLRYRDVNDSLQAELAQRRSRDYGTLVDAYNSGSLPTQTLLDWVDHTLGTISPDSPDYANWSSVKRDLGDRIVGEKDTAVYQDFQHGRMTSGDFLAYITGRRDSYSPTSPKYQEWAAKVEDATVQIKDAAQAKQDSSVFNRYDEGKVSDATYLRYLRTRIDGMKPDDPQRPEWQHRLNQAVFSTAEDKLRFDAERATAKVNARTLVKAQTVATKATTTKQLVNGKWVSTTVPGGTKVIPAHWTTASGSSISVAKTAMRKLMDFYTGYRATLNPGSAEWRTVTRSIDSLATSQASFLKSSTKSGGGSSAAGAAGTGTPGTAVGKGPATTDKGGKLIDPKYTLSNILGLFAADPSGKKKDVAAANKFLALNVSTLNNALTRGDDVWLFQDPRTPTAVVNALNPDGSPVLDKNGKPVLVRGTVYLPVKSETFSNLKTVQSSNLLSSAEVALSKGDYGGYASLTRQAGEALDSARLQDGQYRAQNWQDWYDATKVAVDKLTMAGDYGAALRTSTDLASRLAREAQNPYLDTTRRATLDAIGQQLADNKVMPHANPDGSVIEGAVNLSDLAKGNVTLNPGWHHVLKSNDRGQPEWGPIFDAKQDGSWETTHITVHTTLGNKLVTGEATLNPKAKLDPLIYVKTPDGYKAISVPGTAQELGFVDEHGLVQRAYSVDGGQSWIRPGAGMPAPTLEFDASVALKVDAKGVQTYVDTASGDVVLAQNAAHGWDLNPAYLKANPKGLTWYGQAAWEQAKDLATALKPNPELRAQLAADPQRLPMGAVNQHMTLAFTSPSGVVNLTPSGFRTQDEIAADRRRVMSGGQRGLGQIPQTEGEVLLSRRYNQYQSGAADAAGMAEIRKYRAGLTRGAQINAQLPADTPARYDGYSPPRPAPTLKRIAPSSALPALAPAYSGPGAVNPPALRPATASTTLAKPVAKATPPPKPPTPKPAPKPPTIAAGRTVGGGPGGETATVIKKPAPPPPTKTVAAPRRGGV